MAMFGSNWDEDSKEVGPLSHWLEDDCPECSEDIGPLSHWKDDEDEEEEDFSFFSKWK